MKRILSVLAIAMAVLALSACSPGTGQGTPEKQGSGNNLAPTNVTPH